MRYIKKAQTFVHFYKQTYSIMVPIGQQILRTFMAFEIFFVCSFKLFRVSSSVCMQIIPQRCTKKNNLGTSDLQLSWKSDKFPFFHIAYKGLEIINISLEEYSKTDISIDLQGIILSSSDGMSGLVRQSKAIPF